MGPGWLAGRASEGNVEAGGEHGGVTAVVCSRCSRMLQNQLQNEHKQGILERRQQCFEDMKS